MIQVNIATLKAKLSYYVGRVKEGHEVVVFDRKTPVARLEPLRGAAKEITVIPAKKKPSDLRQLKIKPLRLKTDVAAMLREDRNRR